MRRRGLALAVGAVACSLDVTLSRPWDASVVTVQDVVVVHADVANACGALRPTYRWHAQVLLQASSPCLPQEPRVDACSLRVRVPVGASRDALCDAARGRAPVFGSANECRIRFVRTAPGQAPTPGEHGFYFDYAPSRPRCPWRVAFTPGDVWDGDPTALLECAVSAPVPSESVAPCGARPVGGDCNLPALPACPVGEPGFCFAQSDVVFQTDAPVCASRTCATFRQLAGPRFEGSYCTCRCAVPPELAARTDPRALCQCPRGYACSQELTGPDAPDTLRGSYCVRSP